MFEEVPPYARVGEAARHGTSFLVGPADAGAAMRAIDAARTSALEHRAVRLEGPC